MMSCDMLLQIPVSGSLSTSHKGVIIFLLEFVRSVPSLGRHYSVEQLRIYRAPVFKGRLLLQDLSALPAEHMGYQGMFLVVVGR